MQPITGEFQTLTPWSFDLVQYQSGCFQLLLLLFFVFLKKKVLIVIIIHLSTIVFPAVQKGCCSNYEQHFKETDWHSISNSGVPCWSWQSLDHTCRRVRFLALSGTRNMLSCWLRRNLFTCEEGQRCNSGQLESYASLTASYFL